MASIEDYENDETTMSPEEKHAEILADLLKNAWPPEQAKICADMVLDICNTFADSFEKYEREDVPLTTYLQAAIIIADIIVDKMKVTKQYCIGEMEKFTIQTIVWPAGSPPN